MQLTKCSAHTATNTGQRTAHWVKRVQLQILMNVLIAVRRCSLLGTLITDNTAPSSKELCDSVKFCLSLSFCLFFSIRLTICLSIYLSLFLSCLYLFVRLVYLTYSLSLCLYTPQLFMFLSRFFLFGLLLDF